MNNQQPEQAFNQLQPLQNPQNIFTPFQGDPEIPLSPEEINGTINTLKSLNIPYDDLNKEKNRLGLLRYLISRKQFVNDFDREDYDRVNVMVRELSTLYRTLVFGSIGVSYLFFRRLRSTSKIYGLTHTPWIWGPFFKYFLFPVTTTRLLLKPHMESTLTEVKDILDKYDFDQVKYRIMYNREIYARGMDTVRNGKTLQERVQEEKAKEEDYSDYETWRHVLRTGGLEEPQVDVAEG